MLAGARATQKFQRMGRCHWVLAGARAQKFQVAEVAVANDGRARAGPYIALAAHSMAAAHGISHNRRARAAPQGAHGNAAHVAAAQGNVAARADRQAHRQVPWHLYKPFLDLQLIASISEFTICDRGLVAMTLTPIPKIVKNVYIAKIGF